MQCANWSPWPLLAAASLGEVEPAGLEVPPQAVNESPAPARQSRIAYRTVTS
jgi:hypothetical protein